MCKVIISRKERIIRMADSFKIGNVLPRLFNGSKYETSTSRPSNQATIGKSYNPFAASNMKVDVLTADVFETSNTSFTGSASTSSVSKLKRMASAFVGSIGNAFPTFRQGIENIAAFCGRMKNDISSAWHFLQDTKLPGITEVSRAIKSKWEASQNAKEISMYASRPVESLRKELMESLSIAA